MGGWVWVCVCFLTAAGGVLLSSVLGTCSHSGPVARGAAAGSGGGCPSCDGVCIAKPCWGWCRGLMPPSQRSVTLLVAIGLPFSPWRWPGCPGCGWQWGSEGPCWTQFGVQIGSIQQQGQKRVHFCCNLAAGGITLFHFSLQKKFPSPMAFYYFAQEKSQCDC